jgi:hypothetical protein
MFEKVTASCTYTHGICCARKVQEDKSRSDMSGGYGDSGAAMF